jgi:transcriptional regulator of acetoin/glycerol metabolism
MVFKMTPLTGLSTVALRTKLVQALVQSDGNTARAAASLGVTRNLFNRKMKQLNLFARNYQPKKETAP